MTLCFDDKHVLAHKQPKLCAMYELGGNYCKSGSSYCSAQRTLYKQAHIAMTAVSAIRPNFNTKSEQFCGLSNRGPDPLVHSRKIFQVIRALVFRFSIRVVD